MSNSTHQQFRDCRGQGRDRMRQDLNSVNAYQSIFKHIRSVSQVRRSLGRPVIPPLFPPCGSQPRSSLLPHHTTPPNQAIYLTAMDPFDQEMGPTREFREHFRKLLTETRHGDVSVGRWFIMGMDPSLYVACQAGFDSLIYADWV